MNPVTEATRHILAIEDDADFGPQLAKRLKGAPAEIHLAASVEEARDILDRSKQVFDLVVLDLWIPLTRQALEEKRKLELQYDQLTVELFEDDQEVEAKNQLKAKMEAVLEKARALTNREGGFKVLEYIAKKNSPVRAVMILTAIGNETTRSDATKQLRDMDIMFEYVEKNQTSTTILRLANELMNKRTESQ